MRSLEVNFAPQSMVLPIMACMTALTVLGYCVVQIWTALETQRQLIALETDLASRAASSAQALPTPPDEPASAAPLAYRADAESMVHMSSFDLDSVLQDIEGARLPGVNMVELTLSAEWQSARIKIEFAESQSLMRYLLVLNGRRAAIQVGQWQLVQATLPQSPSAAAQQVVPLQNAKSDVAVPTSAAISGSALIELQLR